MDYQKQNEVLQQCIKDCMNCLTEMVRNSIEEDMQSHCVECVQICEITSTAILHESSFRVKYMYLCADVCDWCADECEKYDLGSSQICAKSCRECAKELRAIPSDSIQKNKQKQEPHGENNPTSASWLG